MKYLLLFLLTCRLATSIKINGTGATFPDLVYQEATFAYRFANAEDAVSYFGTGSSGGKCNIQGFWHTGNADPNAVQASTKRKTDDTAECGKTIRDTSREPIVDFAGSDSIFSTADYQNFPDLLLLPALAGAAVPIYNIPQLKTKASLILSRATIAQIFLGNIRYWNHSAIIADNLGNADILDDIRKISDEISVVVRTDGSGTTEIFSGSLASFSSSPNPVVSPVSPSFATLVGTPGSEKPKWCDSALTDEIQLISVKNCNPNHAYSDRTVHVTLVDTVNRPAAAEFACDSTNEVITAALQEAYGASSNLVVDIARDIDQTLNVISLNVTIAYKSSKNWYEPTVAISLESELLVSISTKQEGGFTNSHYDYPKASPSVVATQNIFINKAQAFSASFSFDDIMSLQSVYFHGASDSADKSLLILSSLKSIRFLKDFVRSVTRLSTTPSSANPWIEYQVIFYNPFPSRSVIKIHIGSVSPTSLPSLAPSLDSLESFAPTLSPSCSPTQTLHPSLAPTTEFAPTVGPSVSCNPSTYAPSLGPSRDPTLIPSCVPSVNVKPSKSPVISVRPTYSTPTFAPSVSLKPSVVSNAPSTTPTTQKPTYSLAPSVSFKPSATPTSAAPTRPAITSVVAIVFKIYDNDNFPIFFDKLNPNGYTNSGKYTCYKRSHNFKPWSYYTGRTNPGVIAEVINRPFSIGYSVLDDARQSRVQIARMKNYQGTIVEANIDSVSYAVMEKGGNFGNTLVAVIVDSLSVNAWPMAGYTYFAVRTNVHLGDCDRRQRAMEFLRDFYFSDTIKRIAGRHGFAMLPDFIRDIVVGRLVSQVKCKDGTYALAKYRNTASPILTIDAVSSIVNTYLSAYQNVDEKSAFTSRAFLSSSAEVLAVYKVNRTSSVGVFTMFSDPLATKLARFDGLQKSNAFITSPFAHIAIVFLAHVNDVFNAGYSIRLTDTIVAKIYGGEITNWNDPTIAAANAHIPAKVWPSSLPIVSVYRSDENDVSAFFSRYLAPLSAAFRTAFGINLPADADGKTLLESSLTNTKKALDNDMVDSYVTSIDGAIGYFLQVRAPLSPVVALCKASVDPTCSDPIKPNDNGASIMKCAEDTQNTLKKTDSVVTYDLMASTTVGCYPISATLDYTLYASNSYSSSVCSNAAPDFLSRVKFSGWMFNGSTVVGPLQPLSIGSPGARVRSQLFQRVCDVQCDQKKLGYQFCQYRDCSYEDGDFIQEVGSCGTDGKRKVTYSLSNSVCLRNSPEKEPPAEISINCAFVPFDSGIGIGSIVICVIGFLVAAATAAMTYFYRKEQVIRRSQTIFIFIFLLGTAMLNTSIIVQIGPNDDGMCIIRPWLFNISATMMFAPLIMKLHRVDRLFNNPKLKKIKVSDMTVVCQVAALIGVDFLILLVWTFAPLAAQLKSLTVSNTYTFVKEPVIDAVCNSGISNPFEISLIVFKGLMLIFGVMKAVATWKIPADLSEAKYFAIAIYNIAAIGGICYLLGDFLKKSDTSIGVMLQCLGMFITAVVAVVVIMATKLLNAHAGVKISDGASETSFSTGKSARQSSVSSAVQGETSIKVQTIDNDTRSDPAVLQVEEL